MTTVTVDDRKRVRIPTAKPKQVFSFQPNADGSVLLVPVQEKERTRSARGWLSPHQRATMQGGRQLRKHKLVVC